MESSFDKHQRGCRLVIGQICSAGSSDAPDIGELFAVATEGFVQQPSPMRHRHPKLYELLSEFFQQDPADRVHQA